VPRFSAEQEKVFKSPTHFSIPDSFEIAAAPHWSLQQAAAGAFAHSETSPDRPQAVVRRVHTAVITSLHWSPMVRPPEDDDEHPVAAAASATA
jgi:hypothetical protein